MKILLEVLLGLGFFLLGPIGFFTAISTKSALREQQRRLESLAADIAAIRNGLVPPRVSKFRRADAFVRSEPRPEEAPPKAESPPHLEPQREPVPAVVEPPPAAHQDEVRPFPQPYHEEATLAAVAEALAPSPPSQIEPDAPPNAAPRSFEEAIGARWTVWVGGVALALGAILLVRYAVESGFLGPGARILAALALAATLLAAGEFLRRRDGGLGARPEAAYIPGVLTAAGTVAAFGAVYAAHALYDFVGPGVTFVALGAVGLGAMLLAAVHGPMLAGLGLIGALATPLLVASSKPSPWPVVVYLAIVGAVTQMLAAGRGWRWLSWACALGGIFWAVVLRVSASDAAPEFADASRVQLALGFIVMFAFRPEGDETRLNPGVQGLVGLFTLGAVFALITSHVAPWPEGAWTLGGLAITLIFLAAGLRWAALPSAFAGAGVIAWSMLRLWPPSFSGVWTPLDFFRLDLWPAPEAPAHFAIVALAACLGVASAAWLRLNRSRTIGFNAAATTLAAATLTPLGGLVIVDLRLTHGERSWAMAAAAAGLAALFIVAAAPYRDRSEANARLVLGGFAAAAIASLGAGIVFALDGGALVVALAFAAAATAFVAARLDVPALRWCVVAFGLAVSLRLLWDPRIVAGALSPRPILNWLLFGYGAPALAFGYAARVLRVRGGDVPTGIAEALATLFAALTFFFEIRHAMNGGDPYAPGSGLVEQGLFAVTALGFGVVLTRLQASRAGVVFHWASLAAGAASMGIVAIGLLLRFNPLFDDVPIAGGAFVNTLVLGYLVPAVMAAFLARVARRSRPLWYWGGAGALAPLLGLAYLMLEVRRLLYGTQIGIFRGFGPGEVGIDVAVCLSLAIATLVLSRRRKDFNLEIAAIALACLGAAIGAFGSGFLANPYLTGVAVSGGAVFNSLAVGYALPFALALVIVNRARVGGSRVFLVAARIAAILWLFVYATLETRRLFHDAFIGWSAQTSDGEKYTYSAVWLALGVAILAYAIWRSSREARYASAVFVLIATTKVFLFDLAGLEGALRALSFIGLGATLIGIGLIYQRFIFSPAKRP